MDGEDRHDHHADDRGSAERRQQPEHQQQAAAELARAGERRVPAARAQPELLEELPGAGEAVPAERAEELLGAVGDEQAADDEAQHQQSEVHAPSVPRRQPI